MLRAFVQVVDERNLGHPSPVHDEHPLGQPGDDAQVVGDPDHGHADFIPQPLEQLDDLRLDGDVERGRRLIGDDDLGRAGDGDGDHHALAHATGELERIVPITQLWVGDAHLGQQLERPFDGLLPGHPQVPGQGLGDLLANGHNRVQRGDGILKDEPNLPPPHVAQIFR